MLTANSFIQVEMEKKDNDGEWIIFNDLPQVDWHGFVHLLRTVS